MSHKKSLFVYRVIDVCVKIVYITDHLGSICTGVIEFVPNPNCNEYNKNLFNSILEKSKK